MRGFLLFLAFLSFPVFALPGDDCAPDQRMFGRWVFNRQFSMGDGCLVQVTEREKPGMTYREYVFDQSGRMLVFNSAGDGDYESATAQRNFFFLPVRQAPTMELDGDGMVVTLASGLRVRFGAEDLVPTSLTPGFELRVTGGVDLAPGGGVEVASFPELMIDAGWAVGRRAYLEGEARSALRAPGLPDCLALNRNIFVLKDPLTGEEFYQPRLRCNQKECFMDYLRRACGLEAPRSLDI